MVGGLRMVVAADRTIPPLLPPPLNTMNSQKVPPEESRIDMSMV